MRKLFIILFITTTAASAFAQGSVYEIKSLKYTSSGVENDWVDGTGLIILKGNKVSVIQGDGQRTIFYTYGESVEGDGNDTNDGEPYKYIMFDAIDDDGMEATLTMRIFLETQIVQLTIFVDKWNHLTIQCKKQ